MQCPAGYYCTGGSAAATCPAGTYSSSTGLSSSAQCTTCPVGSYCTGGQSVTTCTAGAYGASTGLGSSGQCTTCPIGSYCTGGSRTSCPAGTLGTATGLTAAASCTTVRTPACPNMAACAPNAPSCIDVCSAQFTIIAWEIHRKCSAHLARTALAPDCLLSLRAQYAQLAATAPAERQRHGKADSNTANMMR
jgi:hypothetical protein